MEKAIEGLPLSEARDKLLEEMESREDEVVDICTQLLKISTVNPPSDTKDIAYLIGDMAKKAGAEVNYYVKKDPVVNIVAKIKGAGPGERLIFNGHLDTFPVGDESDWTVDPFGALNKDGRLYGRGASDMKGGVASSVFAFLLLAKYKEYWNGEVVLVLVGDEESGGKYGTDYLINEVPDAIGDVMIKGDAGSPMVLRFGEKGPFWIELEAEGVAAHGAHLHKGENAFDKLLVAIEQIKEKVLNIPVESPRHISDAIKASGEVSERFSGAGETEALEKITINIGKIEGGLAPNLVPSKATAQLDIRLPVGVSSSQVEEKVKEVIEAIDGTKYQVLQRYEANYSDINHDIFPLIVKCGEEIMKEKPVLTMRMGASDARIYREQNVPSVNCGLTPYNMGGPDEYIEISELKQVAKIHTLTAFDYLSRN